ncbi:peptidylprolyl isomerase [Fimbriiglobus ruber]|uniref:Peptidyl-prolyl cis-trans isomerase PpiD n=1 Tax=Fimbriiglobus ruber TaxID=1908690 RepID=A0A225D4N4_9BACT|nr:peptidylprolyl isomerase [Fimbriiglobus ruber]OWK35903.1 Peptidyl-prolyl cis-trans isomerase PpiD [Fimbriiglobus ruber]
MRSFTRRAAAVILGAALVAPAFAQTPAPVPGAAPAAPAAGAPAGPLQPATPAPGSLPAPTGKPVERPTGVAATVTGQPIPEVAVWRALRQFPEAEHPIARKEILNHLIENLLIDQYLNALKIAAEPAEVDKLIEELKAELKKSMKDYAKELESMMLTEAEFRAEVTAQMKWDKFLKQQGTDQALQGFFVKRPDIFDGTLVRARHILLTPGTDPAKMAEAKQTLAAIKSDIAVKAQEAATAAPGDALAKETARGKKVDELFAEAAKKHSLCPSKAAGGDLQFFPRVGAMVEPFAEAAFKLNLYEMSDVVETEFGMHLILLTAKNPGKARKFEEVKEDVRAVYAMQLRQAVVGQMKPRAQITINPAPATTPAAAPPANAVPTTPPPPPGSPASVTPPTGK